MYLALNTFPITGAQKSILIIEQFYPESNYNNIASTIHLSGLIDYIYFNKAFNLLLKNNDSLRIRIINDGSQIVQYFKDFEYQDLLYLDFSYENGLDDYKIWLDNTNQSSFPFYDSDLYLFALVKFSDVKYDLYVKCHHIIADFWSVILTVNKLLQLYHRISQGIESSFESYSYKDYIDKEQKYLSSSRFMKDKSYWEEKVSGLHNTNSFRKRLTNSMLAKRKNIILPQAITSKVISLCSSFKISPFILFISLFAVYLWKMNAGSKVVIGTTVINRTTVQDKNTIGAYFNNLPFIVDVQPDKSFEEFLEYLSMEWLELLRHSSYPYVNILRSYRDIHKVKNELFDFTLTFLNASLGQQEVPFDFEGFFCNEEVNTLRLNIYDIESRGEFILGYDYCVEVFSEKDIERLHRCILNIFENATENPHIEIKHLDMLSWDEKDLIVRTFNNTRMDYCSDKTIVKMFSEQVSKSPDAGAVVFNDREFSYRYIDQMSDFLAIHLQQKGIKKEDIVGFSVQRSQDIVIILLGILKSGAAYLPIDPTYPIERINYMLMDSGCRFLITNNDVDEVIGKTEVEKINIKDINMSYDSYQCVLNQPEPTDLAYIIYTSGSTGLPKGVMIEHRAITNFVYALTKEINCCYRNVLSLTTLSFDIFFVETVLPLLLGMKVIIANHDEQLNPMKLKELIAKYEIDVIQATPSRMTSMINTPHMSLGNVSLILVGGEAFPTHLLTSLKSLTQAQIFNMYGPTETTIWSSVKRLDQTDLVTIGKPIGNTQFYILDDNMLPVPVGCSGELYISGESIARGYWNRPELTAERFVNNPFIAGTKMYKTGDLASWLDNGEVVYIGRNDFQVKVRGYRIELGEIENCLIKHDNIEQAVVIYNTTAERVTLYAYYTSTRKLSSSELRQYLLKYLPDYMMPNAFIRLDAFPTTLNGKIDRKALNNPDLFNINFQEAVYVPPQDDLQEKLASVWSEILDIPVIGIDDDFFVIGGDSLAILEILSATYSYNWKLSAQDFYDYPTIRQLSEIILQRDMKSVKEELSYKYTALSKVKTIREYRLDEGIFSGAILLTGVTGFLGIHILFELIKHTNLKIYCLIKGDDYDKRFNNLIRFYSSGIQLQVISDRVQLIKGDITENRFGLTNADYLALSNTIKSVIHSAALVKHFGIYEEFEKVNVKGTQEVIDFCNRAGAHLSYVSTTSVSGNYMGISEKHITFSENDLDIGQDYESNVYVKSKFESESMVLKAVENGLKAIIFRVGILTGRYKDGQFQPNIDENAFYRRLKSIFSIGYLPNEIINEYIEFTPVDYCAKAIVTVLNSKGTKLIYHIFNHNKIGISEVLEIVKDRGVDVKLVDHHEFSNIISSLFNTTKGKEITSGIVQDLIIHGSLSFSTSVEVDSSQTIGILQNLGFNWPVLSEEYILKVIEYMRKVDFLEKAQ